MFPYNAEIIRQTEMTAPLNSVRQGKRNLVTDYANGDINFIGDCCFAYSGSVLTVGDDSPVTVMEWMTGPSYLKGEIIVTSGEQYYNDDLYWQVFFNDVQIAQGVQRVDNGRLQTIPHFLPLIIPPFTKVTFKIANAESSTSREMFLNWTGKVYSGTEVIQGAI
jgi:hypothetical protein